MIGIVILNYNTWAETIICIRSITKYTNYAYKIYVVDNESSASASEEQMHELLNNKKVELIFAKSNRGYAAGNNIGLKRAISDNCEMYFICNSDIKLIDNTIDQLTDFIRENRLCGIAGPALLNEELEPQILHMKCKLTLKYKFINMFLMKTPFKVLCNSFIRSFFIPANVNEITQTYAVSGCFFAISKECLNFIYPLDEHTFLYEEELIIGSKLESTQFKTYVVPNCKVIHAHGKSTKKVSGFSARCMMESEIYYCKKFLNSNTLLLLILELCRYTKYLLFGKTDKLKIRILYFFKLIKQCFR